MPGKILPLTWHPYLLAALFVCWPLRWFSEPRTQVIQPITIPLLLVLLWLPLTIWASADRSGSWVAAGYLLWGITLCLALTNWPPGRTHPEWIAWLLLLCVVGLAVVSPPIVAWKPDFRLFQLPLYDQLTALPIDLGETIHANVLAGVLVIVLPLLLALSLQKSYRILFILLFLFVAGILVLTQSRGGYLAVAAALPVVIMLRWPRLLYAVLPLMIVTILLIQQANVLSILNQLQPRQLTWWLGRSAGHLDTIAACTL